ncbi:hypothetical protein TRVL_06559 [Trypanosoma vivax]|nr:hypothetical protein TRVL_06559 [Trypanosoma vivax]
MVSSSCLQRLLHWPSEGCCVASRRLNTSNCKSVANLLSLSMQLRIFSTASSSLCSGAACFTVLSTSCSIIDLLLGWGRVSPSKSVADSPVKLTLRPAIRRAPTTRAVPSVLVSFGAEISTEQFFQVSLQSEFWPAAVLGIAESEPP